MKILIAHNRYQNRGGEDVVFEAEAALLARAGHTVLPLTVSNDEINSVIARIRTTLAVADNGQGKQTIAEAIERFRPDVVHVHNFFPLLSPAVFDVCRAMHVPAVITLHNYRTICTGGMLLRDGRTCEKCLHQGHVWGVVHRCYRRSLVGSAASAYMIAMHQRRGTFTRNGIRLIALSRFARDKFVQAGFDAAKVDVKPNFMEDPGEPATGTARNGLLYVGRLSPEKGVDILLEAAAQTGAPVRIVGDGPTAEELRRLAPPNVTFLGQVPRPQVLIEMARAKAIVVPSRWYEGFPMVVVEAFASGTPVIASDLGGLAEIVEEGGNGMLFQPGNVNLLSRCIDRMFGTPGLAVLCGKGARTTYLSRYTPAQNLRQLEEVYSRAIAATG
jgi:glycosyltransferase involved in cell wall biosynthesis